MFSLPSPSSLLKVSNGFVFWYNLFPHVSLHEDLRTYSTHCVQIIINTSFQFPVSALGYEKCFISKGLITIFKLINLFRSKMEQTLPGFGVTRFTSSSASVCFLSPFPESCSIGWDDLFIPRHFQRLITGKLTGVDPKIYKEERLK